MRRRYRSEYDAIPTRWARYPNHAELEAARPDFLFASYRSEGGGGAWGRGPC